MVFRETSTYHVLLHGKVDCRLPTCFLSNPSYSTEATQSQSLLNANFPVRSCSEAVSTSATGPLLIPPFHRLRTSCLMGDFKLAASLEGHDDDVNT
jgi:hypothetical protein